MVESLEGDLHIQLVTVEDEPVARRVELAEVVKVGLGAAAEAEEHSGTCRSAYLVARSCKVVEHLAA